MPDIVSVGECMVELFADAPLDHATVFRRGYGGDTLNLLVAATRLGSSTGYISRVGNDIFGPSLVAAWQQEGIDTSQVLQVDGFTGLYFVSLLSGGERQFTYYRRGSAASTLSQSDIDPAYIATAKVLFVSGITQALSASCRGAVLAAVRIAHAAGVRVAYDPNLRLGLWSVTEARQALAEVIPYVNIALPSAGEESELLFGIAEPAALAQHLLQAGVDVVAVKAGAGGCLVASREASAFVSAVAPRGVIDTTGAGDAFSGGFLHGLCRGLEVAEAARWGVAVAGIKVGGRGAVASLPHREEVAALVARLGGSVAGG